MPIRPRDSYSESAVDCSSRARQFNIRSSLSGVRVTASGGVMAVTVESPWLSGGWHGGPARVTVARRLTCAFGPGPDMQLVLSPLNFVFFPPFFDTQKGNVCDDKRVRQPGKSGRIVHADCWCRFRWSLRQEQVCNHAILFQCNPGQLCSLRSSSTAPPQSLFHDCSPYFFNVLVCFHLCSIVDGGDAYTNYQYFAKVKILVAILA